MNKSMVWIGASIGGAIGGYIPALWGDNFLSLWSVILSTVGGLLGIYLVYKIYN
jgi:hypothetical protein